MKTISVYPIIRIDIEVPNNYNGVIENDIDLVADFNATSLPSKRWKLGDVYLAGYSDPDTIIV